MAEVSPLVVNVVAHYRCSNKTLIQSSVSGATVDAVNVQLQLVAGQTTILTSANVGLTVNLTDDQFKIGNYYDVTIVDGTALATAQSQTGPMGLPMGGPPHASGPPPPAIR